MEQTDTSPRQEISNLFLSEKFLYICILMTVTTLTGIIFSISNSEYPYSYFFNPIVSEILSATVSYILTILVVISYIPMIIGTGILWLMRESARTNKDNLKKALYGIMAYRLYFYINIFSCLSGIIIANLLGLVVPIVMMILKLDTVIIIITSVAVRIVAFMASIFYVFFGIYLYNCANFLCEVALTIRINKNMITQNQFLVYSNLIIAGLLLLGAPFSGFTGFIFNVTFAATLVLLNVCIYDHNYKFEAPLKEDVNEFYKNLSFNPEYARVAADLGIKQKHTDPANLSILAIKKEKYKVIINMLLGVSLYNGDLFQTEHQDLNY